MFRNDAAEICAWIWENAYGVFFTMRTFGVIEYHWEGAKFGE